MQLCFLIFSRMASSVDLDQTAPSGSRSTLFALSYHNAEGRYGTFVSLLQNISHGCTQRICLTQGDSV